MCNLSLVAVVPVFTIVLVLQVIQEAICINIKAQMVQVRHNALWSVTADGHMWLWTQCIIYLEHAVMWMVVAI